MLRRAIAATLFVVLMSASLVSASDREAQQPGAQALPDAPEPSFESAQELAAQGQLEKALAQLNQLAARSPEPLGVERLRGIIFYQKEQFPDAIAAFSKAETQQPNDRESMEMHGVSLFRLGRAAEAIPYLEKAHAAVERTNVDPDYVLALCYADVQRYDDSRHAFAAQYGFPPDSAEAYLLAARMFFRRELRDQARAAAMKALELNPRLPLAHELLGEVALAKGEVPGAIQELEAERKINPLDAGLYDRLGDAYLRNEQFTDAQKALDRAVLLEPNSTGPYILLGRTFLKLNQPIEALHYLLHAAQMDPSNHLTHYFLGQAYRATGQVDEANRELKMVGNLQNNGAPSAPGK
jgi:tetratricopeptide (TPR) repeat protein